MTEPVDPFLGLPRSGVCPVCVSPVSEERAGSGQWCCSRRCEKVLERASRAKAAGDEEKFARAVAVKREILRESLAKTKVRADS